MGYRYAVLGAGRQGVAIAYDLLSHGEADEVALLERDDKLLEAAVHRLTTGKGFRNVRPVRVDAAQIGDLATALKGYASVVSALPYALNLTAAKASLAVGAHFCDLGGNTEIVLTELDLDKEAHAANVSLLPDCGLAPGLGNIIAAGCLLEFDETTEIRVRCGGLPKTPKPPFHYKMTFNLNGLVNEYSGEALCLRNGEPHRVTTLTELEEINVDGIGRLEAAVTSGGTSTAPFSFQGKVRDFDYKTLRYPGHFSAMRSFADLGLFSEESRQLDGHLVSPRNMFMDLLHPLVDFPQDRDRVVLFVEARGRKNGRNGTSRWTMIDDGDDDFTAMERTTGFPTAATAYLQVSGKIPVGAVPIEISVPPSLLQDEIAKRGLTFKTTRSWE